MLKCNEERFLSDVKSHEITIFKDDGLYRNIRFSNPNSSTYSFNLITWPGYLCINGDMGTYVFKRIDDMFKFFRMEDSDYNKRNGITIDINPGYWSEKLESVDRMSGYIAYDSEKFEIKVREYYNDYVESYLDDENDRDELWNAIEDGVISNSVDESSAYDSIFSFYYEINGEKFEFIDFFDGGGVESYTYHFIWCLYAIVWGINEYDKFKLENVK